MKFFKVGISVFMVFALFACGSSLFREYYAQIKEPLELHQVKINPLEHKGKLVIWGGKIAKLTNKQEGTYIEIVHFPLDYSGKPKDANFSEGRFIVIYNGFLEPTIYEEGKKITVAGKIKGIDYIKVGEMTQTVPLLEAEKVHLWEDLRVTLPPPSCYRPLIRGWWYYDCYYCCW